MGKPALRIGDMTAHGGTVTVGKPTVLIGKMPAATLGDMHVCPMCTPGTPPIPHVGGPITLGSTGVLIGKTPAARVADLAVCVGPPSQGAMGCMTVLIGEAGSGSQAGSAAAAAAAASASRKGPKAVKPFPVAEPPEPRTENHRVECEVLDSAGIPLPGVRYKLTDPDGNVVVGTTSPEGRIRHDGYAQAGSFKVELPRLDNAKWPKSEAEPEEKLKLSAEAEGVKDGTPAALLVFEERDGVQRFLGSLTSKVQGSKVEAEWALTKDLFPDHPAPDPSGSADSGSGSEPPASKTEYFFFVEAEGLIAVSDRATFADTAEIEVKDENDKPLADTEYEMRLADGTVRKGKLDKNGKAKEDKVPVGKYVVVMPPLVITTKAPSPEKKPAGTGREPGWIRIAKGELGQKETKGKQHNSRVLEYHATTKLQPKTDEVAWCSSFVNWVMDQAGYTGTNSSWAKSWAKWGRKLDKPAMYSLAVIDWGKDENGKDKGGHVGFVMGKKKNRIVLLGGNQSDAVGYSSFPKDKIIAYVVPEDFGEPDYELPEIKVAKGTSYAATR